MQNNVDSSFQTWMQSIFQHPIITAKIASIYPERMQHINLSFNTHRGSNASKIDLYESEVRHIFPTNYYLQTVSFFELVEMYSNSLNLWFSLEVILILTLLMS
jgi:hypothetical protein